MKILSILILFISSNLFAHCPMEFKSTNLCADLIWLDGPFDGRISQLEIVFWENGDPSHTPVSPDFEVEIYSWMMMDNGHNHGGPKFHSTEVLPGVFQSKDVRLFMGRMQGFWKIKVDLINNQQVISASETRVDL